MTGLIVLTGMIIVAISAAASLYFAILHARFTAELPDGIVTSLTALACCFFVVMQGVGLDILLEDHFTPRLALRLLLAWVVVYVGLALLQRQKIRRKY